VVAQGRERLAHGGERVAGDGDRAGLAGLGGDGDLDVRDLLGGVGRAGQQGVERAKGGDGSIRN
jgi:hypothetical protein